MSLQTRPPSIGRHRHPIPRPTLHDLTHLFRRIASHSITSDEGANAILAGSFSAFVCVTAVYVIAKNYGYPLSGFETIAAFIIGWILGQAFDFMRTMITGKR